MSYKSNAISRLAVSLSETKYSCSNNVCLVVADSTYFVALNDIIISNELFLSTATRENERQRGDLSVCIKLAVDQSAKEQLKELLNCKTSIKAKITVHWPERLFIGPNANFNSKII